jgi:hypothetical protein
MKRLNVYLIDKQYEELVKITKEDGIKLSELARRAIDEYVVRRKRRSR